MESPSVFTFNLDGATRVFPIPAPIKGDNYCRIEVDGVVLNDRTKYDIVNNSIVFINQDDVPNGSILKVAVVQSEEAIGNLGSVTSVDTVATNIDNVNAVGNNIQAVVNVSGDLANVDIVSNSITDVTTTAGSIVDVQYLADNIRQHNSLYWDRMVGAARGNGDNEVFFENEQKVTGSYTVPTGINAMTVGPIDILDNVEVEISDNSVWLVL